MQTEGVTDHRIQCRGQTGGFIHLAQDAAGQRRAAVGAHHVVERITPAGRRNDQQTLYQTAVEHRHLLLDHAVALAHAHGVDQHHMFVLQVSEGLPQFLCILHQIDRDPENASVDAQLFVSANPVTVGRNQCHLARSVA